MLKILLNLHFYRLVQGWIFIFPGGSRDVSVDEILTTSSSLPARPLSPARPPSPTQAVESQPTSIQFEQKTMEATPTSIDTPLGTPVGNNNEGSATSDAGAKGDNSDMNGNSLTGGETADSNGELHLIQWKKVPFDTETQLLFW